MEDGSSSGLSMAGSGGGDRVSDLHRINTVQAIRSFAHGYGSVLLGTVLDRSGWSTAQVGIFLGEVALGSALTTLFVGWIGERFSRKSLYTALFLILGAGGTVFAVTDDFLVLSAVALSGALVTDVFEAGAFITMDQASIARLVKPTAYAQQFGNYFGLSILAGSLGALAAGAGNLLADLVPFGSGAQPAFVVFLPLGLLAAAIIQGADLRPERGSIGLPSRKRHGERTSRVGILMVLFGLDSFASGFTTQAFVVYWFSSQFDSRLEVIAPIFALLSVSQSIAFVISGRIASRFGALKTMVFSHALSSIGLLLVPFASAFSGALALLSLKYLFGNMDVPARQSFLVGVLGPSESVTFAIGRTTAVRYVTRPAGVALTSAAQSLWVGLPFVLTGSLKLIYDVLLISVFRRSWKHPTHQEVQSAKQGD